MRNLRVKQKTFILAILAICLIAASTLALTDPQIPRWTVDGGGGQSLGNGYSLNGTMGQYNTGTMSNTEYNLSGGFWGNSINQTSPNLIFLPLVLRNYPLEPCLPEFGNDELLLTLETDAAIERIRTADLNGDGWTDVIVARMIFQTSTTHEVVILLNDQQGGLVDGTQSIFDGLVPKVQHPAKILLHDFNNDGRTDVFIADLGKDADPFPGYQNTLILSAPGGKLVDATANLPQQYEATHSATAADIDGDDDIDIFLGNLGGGGIPPQIWLNDGSGNFSVASGLLPPDQADLTLNWYTASHFADVNRDASPDLILGQGNPNQYSHVLINDGSGNFTKLTTPLPTSIFFPTQQPMDIKSADINRDGYLDLFLVDTRNSFIGRYIQVLINNGDGTFQDETATRLPQIYHDGWLRYLDLLDLNYDGHVDIVATALSGPHVFYLNDGHGVFSEWDHGLDLYSFAFFDLDRDGWRDILLSGSADPGVSTQEWHALIPHIGCQTTSQ